MSETPPLIGTEAMASIESPLAGVNPRSLDALMAEDPAKLSEGEFDQIITQLRALRKTWAENDTAKQNATASEAPGAKRAPRAKGPKVNIDLGDLF